MAVGPSRIFVAHDKGRLLAVNYNGSVAFDFDYGAVIPGGAWVGNTTGAPSVVALDDGTVLVTGPAAVAAISATGTMTWSAQPPYGGTVSRPAVAANGAIYTVQDFGQGTNYPLPYLALFSKTGASDGYVDLGTAAERTNGFPPTVTAPVLGPSGISLVVGTSSGPILRTVNATTKAITNAPLAGLPPISALIPVAAGGWFASSALADQLYPGCATSPGATGGFLAKLSSTGATTWSLPYRGAQYVPPPVTGEGSDLLLAFGDCADGAGAGVHLATTNGVLVRSNTALYGDGTVAIASGNGAIYVLEQNRAEGPGVADLGPVFNVIDRTTATKTASEVLPCIKPGNEGTTEALSFMSVLDDGTLVVACSGIGATGGVFALDAKAQLQGAWPLLHGSNRAQQRL